MDKRRESSDKIIHSNGVEKHSLGGSSGGERIGGLSGGITLGDNAVEEGSNIGGIGDLGLLGNFAQEVARDRLND